MNDHTRSRQPRRKGRRILPRNRKSAKAAGARFERHIADYLAENIDDRIDRRVKTGAADKGDIANLRDLQGRKIVVECKDYGGRLEPAAWIKEAQIEATNDGALLGVVVAKRKGTTKPEDQWVITTLGDLTKLLK